MKVGLAIEGMTCGSCAARVEQRLNALDGVSATVNLSTERATATLPDGFSVDRLLEAVSAAGYGASLVPRPQHDAVRSLRRRLVVTAILAMPICDLALGFSVASNVRFPGWQWCMGLLAAPIVTWAAWPFYVAAWRAARHGTSTMDTLVSMGIVVSTVWSVWSMAAGQHVVFLDLAAVITLFVLAGRYYEARSRARTASMLRALAAVGAREATVLLADGNEVLRAVRDLSVGDRLVVRPGETIPTDGEVEIGSSAVDSRVMTGESAPVEISPGSTVLGGTVLLNGRVVIRATRLGADSQLGRMYEMVEHAQNEKASVQRTADKIAAFFVPGVLLAALVTGVGWLLAGGPALDPALSVLVIACPCALGLATPAALHVASGAGARRGIFFKGYRTFEASRVIDTVVFDKTGTLTEGRMSLGTVTPVAGFDRETVLRLAAAVESGSAHPIARAIVTAASGLGSLPEVEDFRATSGVGVAGVVEGRSVIVERAESEDADTIVQVMLDGVVAGTLSVRDSVRASAAPAVRVLLDQGLRCVLLTGDHAGAARAIGAAVGIEEIHAGVLPDGKVRVIERLRSEGRSVAMVGDGVNDAGALAASDLGVAVGTGTDIARGAADLVVVRDDLMVVSEAIGLARRTLSVIRSNLAWAFLYNVVAIPLAAFGLLNPMIAAGAMASSSAFVVWNSSRLSGSVRKRP